MSGITKLIAEEINMPFEEWLSRGCPQSIPERRFTFHGIELVTTRGGYPTMDDNGVVTLPADGVIIVPDGQQLVRMQAGEQLYAGDAIVERDGLVYRANERWRPATPENCPHFWVPRATYSIPSEVQTTSTVPMAPPAPPFSFARMAEIMESVQRTPYVSPWIDWARSRRAVSLQRRAQYVVEDIQPPDDDEEETQRFTQVKAAFGDLAPDADRETIDVDDLDTLFANIDEVLGGQDD